MNDIKILKIEWLDDCNKCGFSKYANVYTRKGCQNLLYEGNIVECPNCDNKGEIETDMGCAYVSWEFEDGYRH